MYDVKTTDSLQKFTRNVYDYGYHRQAAWYIKLAKEAGLEVSGFVFYVIETSAPYCHKLVKFDQAVLDDGLMDIEAAFEIYKGCYKTGNWNQGYSDDILTIKQPYWRRKENESYKKI